MHIIPWIILAAWVIFLSTWVVSAFSVKRDARRSPWLRLWWVRIGIAIVAIGWVVETSHTGEFTHHIEILFTPINGVVAVIGAVLCVLGITFAIWARFHLGRNWSPVPTLKEGHELVTSGPYAFVRHPIYTGIIVAVLGSTIASPAWVVIFVVVTAVFVWRVHVEETLMMHQFPTEYPPYKARTWALLPWVW